MQVYMKYLTTICRLAFATGFYSLTQPCTIFELINPFDRYPVCLWLHPEERGKLYYMQANASMDLA